MRRRLIRGALAPLVPRLAALEVVFFLSSFAALAYPSRDWLPRLWQALVAPREAVAGVTAVENAALSREGEQIFRTETFGGNGRTCATCHRPERNFTIDPSLIQALPANDPLFLAQNALSDPNIDDSLVELDSPAALRNQGLFRVHPKGFDQPAVLRAPLPCLRHRSAASRYGWGWIDRP